MSKTIAVIAGKGGVGKTTLSFNLAKEFEAYIVSNDRWSKIGLIYDDAEIINDISFIENNEWNFIYDFAGHIDGNIIDIIKQCDITIFVTTPDILSLGGTVEVISELQEFTKDCFVVANQIGMKGTRYEAKRALEDLTLVKESCLQFDVDVLPMRYTSTWHDGMRKGNSMKELADSKLLQRVWRTELEQFENILKRINNG